MANDVKVLKLITGEEVLSRVEQNNTMLILDSPMTLQTVPGHGGQMGFRLIPWIMSGKSEKITISIDHVISQDDPKDQPEKDYLASVTGLAL